MHKHIQILTGVTKQEGNNIPSRYHIIKGKPRDRNGFLLKELFAGDVPKDHKHFTMLTVVLVPIKNVMVKCYC